MHLEVTLKYDLFYSTDPISFFPFLNNFKSACNLNKIHEEAAMLILFHFMKKMASVALVPRMRLEPSRGKRSEETLSSYGAVLNHLVGEYASEYITAESVT